MRKDTIAKVMREMGRKGGQVRTKKGLASLSPERRAEIAAAGVEARKKAKAEAPASDQ